VIDSAPFVFLPGAGGELHLAALSQNPGELPIKMIVYPGWQRFIERRFTVTALIDELSQQIARAVPDGPIRIVGYSIGGHFGYAAALRLQAMGREIAGLCAIDSFMIKSSHAATGWQGRAMTHGLDLLGKAHMTEFLQFVRSKFWRALLRLAGGRLPGLLRRVSSGRLSSITTLDPILEAEITIRLLIREAAPWIAALDRHPAPLVAPAALLRTHGTAGDDAAWRRRCPTIEIREIPGDHGNLFEAQNVQALRGDFIAATRDWR
jgi:thioesterase domain-containing protein